MQPPFLVDRIGQLLYTLGERQAPKVSLRRLSYVGFFTLFCLPLLTGASHVSSAKVSRPDFNTLVRDSVERNAAAKNLIEWESSGVTPRDIFTKVRTDRDAASLCHALLSLPTVELTLFQNEIESESSTPSLHCASQLLNRLEDYWSMSSARVD